MREMLATSPPLNNDTFWRPCIGDVNPPKKPLLTKEQWGKMNYVLNETLRERLYATNALLRNSPAFKFCPSGSSAMKASLTERREISESAFSLVSLPLPIIHKDFENKKSFEDTLDWLNGTSRRCCEVQEKLVLGVDASIQVFGLCNHEHRRIVGLEHPSSADWTPKKLLVWVLDQLLWLNNNRFYGPYLLFYGPAWESKMADDYYPTGPQLTLRERIGEIAGVAEKPILCWDMKYKLRDGEDDFSLVLVQATPDVIRIVTAVEPTVVQKDDSNFTVLMSRTPQIRADCFKNLAVVHGVVK